MKKLNEYSKNLLDASGNSIETSANRKRRILKRSKYFVGLIVIVVGGLAAFTEDVKEIVMSIKELIPNSQEKLKPQVTDNSSTGSDDNKDRKSNEVLEVNPKLTNCFVSVNGGEFEISGMSEDKSNHLDVTISSIGSTKILIDKLVVRHWRGEFSSVEEGRLVSSAKYRFKFRPGGYHEFALDPPLVLNPKKSTWLRFEIELVVDGYMPSVGGILLAKLGYSSPRGRRGELPLFDPSLFPQRHIKNGTVKFPDFKSDKPKSADSFKLTDTGKLIGKWLE